MDKAIGLQNFGILFLFFKRRSIECRIFIFSDLNENSDALPIFTTAWTGKKRPRRRKVPDDETRKEDTLGLLKLYKFLKTGV